MPHSRKLDKVLARRARALERGYVVAKRSNCSHALVPDTLAPSAKVMTTALEVYRKLDVATWTLHHGVAQAMLHAQPLMGDSSFKGVLRLNAGTGRLKHGKVWVDLLADDDRDCVASGVGGAHEDPLQHMDPWLSFSLSSIGPVADPCGSLSDDLWQRWIAQCFSSRVLRFPGFDGRGNDVAE